MRIVRAAPVYDSFRVKQVRGIFDIPDKKEIVHEWQVALPLDEKPWQIGLICGASGSGKTTIASEVFKDSHIHNGSLWPEKASMLDGFNPSIKTKEVVEVLSSVGLSSPPHWLKPFHCLSNGQKFRAELARVILDEHKRVVFDEFTSVVDRDVAKVCCAALAKTLRKRKEPQLVALSCHFDVIDWLQPDWVYEVSSECFEWRRLRPRPDIRLELFESSVSAWQAFKGHHYLSADVHRASTCYVAIWNGKPVGFTAVLHFPHPRVKNFKREHRTVVLPDYQGVGIGNALSEAVAELYRCKGFRYISTTSHPSMIWHRSKSPLWATTRIGHTNTPGTAPSKADSIRQTLSCQRHSVSFEYVGRRAT